MLRGGFICPPNMKYSTSIICISSEMTKKHMFDNLKRSHFCYLVSIFLPSPPSVFVHPPPLPQLQGGDQTWEGEHGGTGILSSVEVCDCHWYSVEVSSLRGHFTTSKGQLISCLVVLMSVHSIPGVTAEVRGGGGARYCQKLYNL